MTCNKTEITNDITKRLLITIKRENPVIKHADAVAEARRLAPLMVEQSIAKLKADEQADFVDEVSALPAGVVQELNASKPKIGKTPITVHEVNGGKVFYTYPKGTQQYSISPKEITLDQKSAEAVVAKYHRAPLGSIAEPASFDELADWYDNTDGTISNSANVNTAMIEVDKKNLGESFDSDESAFLTETLNTIIKMVGDVNGIKLKIKKQTLGKISRGEFNPSTNEMTLAIADGNQKGVNYNQTNQEIFVHELVHAVTEFLFDGSTKAGKDPQTAELIVSIKNLYGNAHRNVKSYKDLLPKGVNHSKADIAKAKQLHDYIFDAGKEGIQAEGTGLEEFMAHLMTNKMFRTAMDQLSAIEEQSIEEGISIVEKLVTQFQNFIKKIIGMVAHVDNDSITNAGSKLLFDVMESHRRNGDRVKGFHPAKIVEKASETLSPHMDKLDEVLQPIMDKVGDILQDPIVKVIEKEEAAEIKELNDLLDSAKETGEDITELEEQIELAKIAQKAAVHKKSVAEAVKKLNKKLDANAKRGIKINSFMAKDSSTILRKLRNSTVGTISIINDLISYIFAAGYLREVKALDPKGYGAAMKHISTMISTIEQTTAGKMLNNFMSKDGVYNQIADAILTLTHTVDKMREGAYEEVLADSKRWFGKVDINSDAYKKQNEALNDVILSTDIQSLGLDVKELQELLKDPKKVDAKVEQLKAKIAKLGKPGMIEDALSLASYMTSGVGLTTNAKNIAHGFGRDYMYFPGAGKELFEAVDQLASYEALRLTSKDSKDTLRDFINGKTFDEFSEGKLRELGYKKGWIKGKLDQEGYTKQVAEGVQFFMDYAYGSQVSSEEEVGSNYHNVIKGYVKESFDTGVEVVFKPMRDRADLEKLGYKFIRAAKGTPGSTTSYGLFTRRDGKTKRVNGALGLQSTKMRGFTLKDKINEENYNADFKMDKLQKEKMFKKVLAKALVEYDQDRSAYHMQPVYNKDGAIIDFRSTMSKEEKLELMDMETRGTQNLARTHATFGTAVATLEHNKSVLKDLKADADKNYKGNEDAYAVIKPRAGITAADYGIEDTVDVEGSSEYEQLWARLPKTTQEYAANLYGGEKNIIVRKDLLLPAFGENEISLADTKLAANASIKYKQHFKQAERYWQDFMQIAKSNIVIKTPEVLFGNIVSNAKILFYLGVNPVKGIKLLKLSMRELPRYERDTRELHQLQREQKTIKNKRGEKFGKNGRRIVELERSIKENLVAPLIDAGMFQSIVEDVSTKQDNNRVANFANAKLDQWIPNETANTAIQYMFLTEKTKPFQALLKATQVSDFHFRFVQYYDAIEKGDTSKQALRDVTDNYINYEDPLNEWVRYGDRMGPFFFVRYFTGIQRVIKKIAKKRPGRVAIDIGLQEFVTGDVSDILDQSIIDKGLATYLYTPFDRLGDVFMPPGIELVNAYR